MGYVNTIIRDFPTDSAFGMIYLFARTLSVSFLSHFSYLDSLIQHYRKRKCTKCGSAPDDPAVCLVCGKFTCLQGSCCVDRNGARDKYECIQVGRVSEELVIHI